jgi:TolB-like protein
MKHVKTIPGTIALALCALLFVSGSAMAQGTTPADKAPVPTAATATYTAAILSFEERGTAVKDMGQKAADILFAKLSAQPDLMLVERRDLEKILQEAEINISGIVNPQEAMKIGQLTGAKVIITGSVFEVNQKLYLVAKVIGTETSRVFANSVDGRMDELASLAERLAAQVGQTVTAKGQELLAKEKPIEDRIADLKTKLGTKNRPKVFVHVAENHVGQPTYDPAAQTELIYFLKETGFEVIDPDKGNKAEADVIISGEGFSEFALRKGNLVSVKARLELKATEKTSDRVIATDRTTTVKVDLTEQIAGKNALQEAAAQLAERLIPKLVQ